MNGNGFVTHTCRVNLVLCLFSDSLEMEGNRDRQMVKNKMAEKTCICHVNLFHLFSKSLKMEGNRDRQMVKKQDS